MNSSPKSKQYNDQSRSESGFRSLWRLVSAGSNEYTDVLAQLCRSFMCLTVARHSGRYLLFSASTSESEDRNMYDPSQ